MAPPADIPKVPGIGLPPSTPAAPLPPDNALAGRKAPLPAPPAADLADIRPLDVPGGLQILIAEVRAALERELLLATGPADARPAGATTAGSAAPGADVWLPEAVPGAVFDARAASEAARQVVDLLLRSLPAETADDAALGQRLPALEVALQSAGGRALEIISAWHDSAPATQAAAGLAVQMVANAVSDEPLLGAWMRPEWAGFLPRLEQFRRRRRRLRRRLVDPDYPHRGTRADNERR